MSFMGSFPASSQAMRVERRAQIVRARLLRRDGSELDIVIRNISPMGVGASTRDVAPVRGERVSLLLPGEQRIGAVVRWFAGKAFGLQLDMPIDLTALTEAIQRQNRQIEASRAWEVETRHRVVTPVTDPAKIRRV